MTHVLQRGSVVLSGERWGVVWAVREDVLVVLPIVEIRPRGRGALRRANDVELSLAELLASGIVLPEVLVRTAEPIEVCAADQVHVGELAGAAICRVVHGFARAAVQAEQERRWALERQHRETVNSMGATRL